MILNQHWPAGSSRKKKKNESLRCLDRYCPLPLGQPSTAPWQNRADLDKLHQRIPWHERKLQVASSEDLAGCFQSKPMAHPKLGKIAKYALGTQSMGCPSKSCKICRQWLMWHLTVARKVISGFNKWGILDETDLVYTPRGCNIPRKVVRLSMRWISNKTDCECLVISTNV